MMSRFGARSFGAPVPSYPSKTCTLPRSGRTVLIGASSESLPRSTSCIAQTPVTAFVIEAIQTTVSAVMEARCREITYAKTALVD